MRDRVRSDMGVLSRCRITQHGPVDVGAQIFAADLAGSRTLNVWASFRRNLTLRVGPLRNEDCWCADRSRDIAASSTGLVHVIEKLHIATLSDSLNAIKRFASSFVKRFAL